MNGEKVVRSIYLSGQGYVEDAAQRKTDLVSRQGLICRGASALTFVLKHRWLGFANHYTKPQTRKRRYLWWPIHNNTKLILLRVAYSGASVILTKSRALECTSDKNCNGKLNWILNGQKFFKILCQFMSVIREHNRINKYLYCAVFKCRKEHFRQQHSVAEEKTDQRPCNRSRCQERGRGLLNKKGATWPGGYLSGLWCVYQCQVGSTV